MSDPTVSFGDNVRILVTPETERAGLAGKAGQVYGHTTPSATHVDVIGHPSEDFAINVHVDDCDEAFWFAPQLVEFVDHGVGAEIKLDGVPKIWTRNDDGGWDETSTSESKPRRSWFKRLFGRGNRDG